MRQCNHNLIFDEYHDCAGRLLMYVKCTKCQEDFDDVHDVDGFVILTKEQYEKLEGGGDDG